MTEPTSSPKRLTNVAGVVGLATAVVGLVGTGLTVWAGMRSGDKAEPAAIVSHTEDLSSVPAEIDGYMSGPAFVDWSAANQLCLDQDADNSCIVTASLAQRGPRAIRMRETFYIRLPDPALVPLDLIVADDFSANRRRRPDGTARVDLVDYTVTREGLCVDRRGRTAGAARTLVLGVYEDGEMIPLSSSALTAFRAQLREDLAGESVGDDQCWRFKLTGGKLHQDYFIDGVLQPGAGVDFDFLPAERQPLMRIPGNKS